MSKVVVHEVKTAIRKFRTQADTKEKTGKSMSFGLKVKQPKCFNVLSDYKKVCNVKNAK